MSFVESLEQGVGGTMGADTQMIYSSEQSRLEVGRSPATSTGTLSPVDELVPGAADIATGDPGEQVNSDRTAKLREGIETWFIQSGTPTFVDRSDIGGEPNLPFVTRAVGALLVVYFGESLAGIDMDRSLGGNLIGVVVALGLLLCGLWLASIAPRTLPAGTLGGMISYTSPFVIVFILVPAFLPLLSGEGLSVVLVLAVLNASMLLIAGYGVLAMSRRAIEEVGRQLLYVVRVLPIAMPFLLGFVTFLFMQAEVWQTVARLNGPLFYAVILLFPGLTTIFASGRLIRDVESQSDFSTWESVQNGIFEPRLEREEARNVVKDHELAYLRQLASSIDLRGEIEQQTRDQLSLSSAEKRNASLLMRFAVGLRGLAVGIGVTLFFVIVGSVLVTPEIASNWIGRPVTAASVQVLWRYGLWGESLVFSEELIKVALFMGAFSAMLFSWHTIADQERHQFFDDIDRRMSRLLAARFAYRVAQRAGWEQRTTTDGLPSLRMGVAEIATQANIDSLRNPAT